MDERDNSSLVSEPVKGRGRPRKVVSDADGGETVSDLHTVSGGQWDAINGVEPGAVFDSWPRVVELAMRLSENGELVTQLHTKGNSTKWAFWSVGANSYSNSDGDYVVTSDGVKHGI
jgi:hypothetical protein